MKPALTFLLLISLQQFSFSQDKKLAITHLTGDFYIYTTYNDFSGTKFPSNSMYLVTTKGIVMFDTPWDSTQWQPLLDSLKKRHNKNVILSISTHFHADRTAGLNFFKKKGVKTYSSKLTKDFCKKRGEEQAEFIFTKDTMFTAGNYSFLCYYPGAGHSKDNIVIWFDKDKILYGGCFIKSTDANDLGNVGDADLKKWPTSIEKLIKKFPSRKYVIPGHFSWSNNLSLEHTIHLLNQHNNSR